MTKRRSILLLFIALLTGLVFFFWPRPESSSLQTAAPATKQTNSIAESSIPSREAELTNAAQGPAQHKMEPDWEAVREMKRAFGAPIEFYGKVVDEKDNPVSGASVHFSAADKPWKEGSKYRTTADLNGFFSISGVKGAGLYVSVWKKGYYGIPEKSYGSFAYGVPPSGGVDRPIPTKDNPAIFVLRKMGQTEPLIKISSRQYETPKDGTPVHVDLRTGKKDSSNGDMIVESWTDEKNRDQERHFDWKCRVTVPGGGLAGRRDQFEFEAPTSGYQQSVTIEMPKSLTGNEWKNSFEKEFFVKLADGRYARLKFAMRPGPYNFFVLESYLNPTGSRNLEYDPAKEIKPGK